MPCNSVLCVTLHVSFLPFPPKCFPKAYESTDSFHHSRNHSRIFLIYGGNKWPYQLQLSKQWEAIFKKLSASYRGEGEKEEKKKRNKFGVGLYSHSKKKKKKSKISSNVVGKRMCKYLHCSDLRWWAYIGML